MKNASPLQSAHRLARASSIQPHNPRLVPGATPRVRPASHPFAAVTNLVRQEIMTAADTVVVKVGSRVLTREDGSLDDSRVGAIADQLARLRLDGRKPVLVSSGAVAAGMGRLGLKR